MGQSEMNLDLLKPFDLEAARNNEPVLWNGKDVEFIGIHRKGGIALWIDGQIDVVAREYLRMKPLAWVEEKPVYKGETLYLNGYPYFVGNGVGVPWDMLTWTKPEPVKKTRTVKMWQALLSDGAGFFTSSHFFTDENEAKVRFEKRFIRLLPHTEIEVEE